MTVITELQQPREATPFPLGRNLEHDDRSRAFPFITATEVPVVNKVWRRYGPTLNQGNVGACTLFAGGHALNSLPNYVAGEGTVRAATCLEMYARATQIDEFPGQMPEQDTGSSGNAACKVLFERGYITEWRWAFGLDHLLQALMKSPVMVGTWWYSEMFYPSATGLIRVGGSRVGGHEYVISGVHSVRDRLLRVQNSWGPWGDNGRALITFDDMDRLLREDGDAVIPVGGPWS